jgi:long-chain acyl-CoA synthetase
MNIHSGGLAMTIAQMIRDRHQRWKDRPCLRVKDAGGYRDISWDAFYTAALELAGALVAHGVQPRDRIAILGRTCAEWAMADTAILSAAAVCVPLYPSLSRAELEPLLRRSGARGLFLADAEQLASCLPLLDRVECLEFAVVFDPPAAAGCPDPRVFGLDAFRDTGAGQQEAVTARLEGGQRDDLATIIFTSGTTGKPKGVLLSHANILSNVEASLDRFAIGPGDVCLAHLPLAHILERMAGYYLMLSAGATIAYAESIQTVAQDLVAVRPTLAVSVPRIFEKIYAGIQTKAAEAPGPVRALTFWALRVAREVGGRETAGQPIPLGLSLQRALADRLVYAKVRRKLGGRLRFFISGGAPLAPELSRFFSALGVRIYEGYGLTETSPVLAVNYPGHNRVGTVGPALANVELRIAADGEILARGPSVFRGYHADDAATREAFTADGYFQTGDIGEITPDGYLRITDRKKDLIVTAGGKNVAPQKVENVLKMSKYIAEAMLYGDRKKFLSALIVPDEPWLRRYAQLKQVTGDSLAEWVRDPRVQDFYARLIEDLQRKAELASYESVKKFVLLDQEFSTGDGEVTPTLKLRRRKVTEHYRDRLDALYEEA